MFIKLKREIPLNQNIMQEQLSRIFDHIAKFRENLTKKIEHLRSTHPVITDIMKLNHMSQSIIAV